MRDRIESVGRILMAAAHADQHVEPQEVDRIEEILREIWGQALPLPEVLTRHLSDFDPATFDLDEAVLPLIDQPAETKRRILELVVSVHDADGELDYREDAFVKRLGDKLGLARAQFEDLLLEILPATPGTEPDAEKPAAEKKPEAKNPEAKKPAAKKAATKKKPMAKKKAAAKRPAAKKKAAAKRPAAKKKAAAKKKPAAKKKTRRKK
jgi:uncharacterized tellurite resistance protein B-like protein